MSLLFAGVLLATGLERLVELWLSRQNAAWARAHGGIEVGAEHWPVMVAMHVLLLGGSAVEVVWQHRPFVPAIGYPMLAAVVGMQALRYWCIASLGRRWNVRVWVLPDAPAVVRGPYRFLRHPNYVAVVVEGLTLPLVQNAYVCAALFFVCNGLLLKRRIAVEQDALQRIGQGYERVGHAWAR